MKKRLTALILVFILTFTAISDYKSKQAKALSIAGGLAIGEIIKTILFYGGLVAAGYVINEYEFGTSPTKEKSDVIQSIYGQNLNLEPEDEPPSPKPLTPLETATLTALLSEQGIKVGSDLYNQIFAYSQNTNVQSNIPDPSEIVGTINLGQYSSGYGNLPAGSYTLPDNEYSYGRSSGSTLYYEWKPEFLNKVYMLVFQDGPLSGRFVYIRFLDQAVKHGSQYWPEYRDLAQIISPDNSVVTYPIYNYVGMRPDGAIYYGSSDFTTFSGQTTFGVDWEPVTEPPEFLDLPVTMVDPAEYAEKFVGVDLSPLSGLASSPEELIGKVNGSIPTTDEEFTKIYKAFNDLYTNFVKNPNQVGAPAEPSPPEINPNDGKMNFDNLPSGPILDPEEIPDNASFFERVVYFLKGIWYQLRDLPGNIVKSAKSLFTKINQFVDDFLVNMGKVIDNFFQKFSDWWQNNVELPWQQFKQWLFDNWEFLKTQWEQFKQWLFDSWDSLLTKLNSLPDLFEDLKVKLGEIKDVILGIPQNLLHLVVPTAPEVNEVFKPVHDQFKLKIEPAIAPFTNLAFYEKEYEDVYVNLKFGNIQGRYKILDYQYLKSSRDAIKSIIRAFFWILILFFNLDQVHRIIRNQSIIQSYVRKIDPPKGRDK